MPRLVVPEPMEVSTIRPVCNDAPGGTVPSQAYRNELLSPDSRANGDRLGGNTASTGRLVWMEMEPAFCCGPPDSSWSRFRTTLSRALPRLVPFWIREYRTSAMRSAVGRVICNGPMTPPNPDTQQGTSTMTLPPAGVMPVGVQEFGA